MDNESEMKDDKLEEPDILPDKEIRSLAKKLSTSWSDVAYSLDFKYYEIEQLKTDKQTSVVDQATDMLMKWKRKKKNIAEMIDELFNALRENGRTDLVEDVEKKLKPDLMKSSCSRNNYGYSTQLSEEDELAEFKTLFIETDAVQHAYNTLEAEKLILITGINGSGKTELGYHLFNEKEKVIKNAYTCRNMKELVEQFDVEESQVLYLDDVFGTLDINDSEVAKWSEMMESLPCKRDEQRKAGCVTYMIFCSRKSIIEKLKQNKKTSHLFSNIIVDVSDIYERMERSQHRTILEQVWKHYNPKLELPSFTHDVSVLENVGFWFRIVVFSQYYQKNGEHFWKDPFRVLITDIKNNVDKSEKYFTLCRKIVYKERKNMTELLELSKDEIQMCMQHPGLFKRTKEKFEFHHIQFYKEIELHIAGFDVVQAIKILSADNLSNIVLPAEGKRRKMEQKSCLILKNDQVIHLISRLIDEVTDGKVETVCKHTVWDDENSVNLLDDLMKFKPIEFVKGFLTKEDKAKGSSFLYWGVKNHKRLLCVKLLKYIAGQKDWEDKNVLLSRALIGACTVQQNISITRDLIRYGADVNFCYKCQTEKLARNDEQGTRSQLEHECPLDIVMKLGFEGLAEELLKNKAIIPHSTWKEWQIIHKAAEIRDKFVCHPTFLKAFYTIFSKCSDNKLGNASEKKEIKGFYTFFDEIEKCCKTKEDIFLTFARFGCLSKTLTEAFFHCEVDINCSNQSKENALHLLLTDTTVTSLDKIDVILSLLDKKCDPNLKSKSDETPLSLAIKNHNSHPKIVKILLEANANPNITVKEEKTYLHLCVESKMATSHAVSIITLLVKHGCNPASLDKNGKSALDMEYLKDELSVDILQALCKLPFHACVSCTKLSDKSKEDIIQLLHSKKINANGRDEQNHTPLSKAISMQCGQTVVKCLLGINADANLLYGENQSILQVVLTSSPSYEDSFVNELKQYDKNLQTGKIFLIVVDILKSKSNYFFLLKSLWGNMQPESKFLKSHRDVHGRTLLHLCTDSILTDRESLEISTLCINNGYLVDDVDIDDLSALDLAIRNQRARRTETILMLMQHSKFKKFKTNKFVVTLYKSGQLCTEILRAAHEKGIIDAQKAKKSDILLLLAENGLDNFFYKYFPAIDHNKMHVFETENAIPKAIPCSKSDDVSRIVNSAEVNREKHESEFIKCLLKCGVDINRKSSLGRTALALACHCDRPDTSFISALCKNGANPNEKGSIALHACVSSKAKDSKVKSLCEILVKFKAKINACDDKDRTALLVAIKQEIDRTDTIRFLLQNCSHINKKDIKGDGCLHYCIAKRVSDIKAYNLMTTLLDYNPLMEGKNNHGLTPLNYAATFNTLSRNLCILCLLQKGAKVNSLDDEKRTPIYNVIRCLKGHNIRLSLERSMRLALLFAYHANPGFKTSENKTAKEIGIQSGDETVFTMMQEFPISTERLAILVRTKLDNVSKHYRDQSNDELYLDLQDGVIKKSLCDILKQVNGYLCEIVFEEEEKDDDTDKGSDCVTQAQVALTSK